MFVYDPVMAEAVFDYCRHRLSLDPVPLDHPVPKEVLEATLAGLVTPGGQDPVSILSLFAERVVTSVISCDSPRFLAFVPAAPTKASLLFDMVVSASSLQGTSWLEASGAVMAENQALRFLADMAGMPAEAGGCFVSGGSAANLSALVVARDWGRARLGRQHVRVAISEEAHSSVGKALHILGTGVLTVEPAGHRLTGEALDAALHKDAEPSDVVAVVATAGTTNAGIVDDLAGIAQVCKRRDLLVPYRRRLRRRRPAVEIGGSDGTFPGLRGSKLLRRGPAQVAFRPFRLRRPSVPGTGAGQGRARAKRLLPRPDPHRRQ